MKNPKDRVIAIDYFRGLCILMVVINHASIFSLPFAYLVGDGRLWVSAAEMFLVLSGITFAIVRGDEIKTDFKRVLKRTWRRAAIIYLVNIAIVFTSMLLAFWLTNHGLRNDVIGGLPSSSGFSLMIKIFDISYSIGWAAFLMYYALFLLIAPFAMYFLKTRFWLALPLVSIIIFAMNHYHAMDNTYDSIGLWQIYFVMGLTLGRFRGYFSKVLSNSSWRSTVLAKRLIVSTTIIMIFTNYLVNFGFYKYVVDLVNQGWLPEKLQAGYLYMLTQKPTLDNLFMDARIGWLRPLMAIMIAATAYILFQKYHEKILDRSGNFIITMGRNTLAIFAAQAIAIPVLAAFGLPKTLVANTLLTAFLILVMWLIAQTDVSRRGAYNYVQELRTEFYAAKNSYISRYED